MMKILLNLTFVLYVLATLSFIASLLGNIRECSHEGRLRKGALLLLSLGILAHLIALSIRAYYSGRLPAVGVFETLSLYSLIIAVFTLVVAIRYKEVLLSSVALIVAVVAFAFALKGLAPPRVLPPILQTYWFEIHVIASFTAYALFTLAFTAGLLYILYRAFSSAKDAKRITDFHDITLRAILWGFFFFSLSMFSGAIWGYLAWGAYWQWEPKTLWSFIVWFWFAGVIHLIYLRKSGGGAKGESKKRWREYSVPVASIIGFVMMLFTWLGVGLLMKNSHSF
ncbi:MAG: cytochrome c biogenesis protein CcsA [Deltaproteobacteria bacterium]|nr:cytochrome c biogenesis protein CcsA [Deltaproteobacteria bacterium]